MWVEVAESRVLSPVRVFRFRKIYRLDWSKTYLRGYKTYFSTLAINLRSIERFNKEILALEYQHLD